MLPAVSQWGPLEVSGPLLNRGGFSEEGDDHSGAVKYLSLCVDPMIVCAPFLQDSWVLALGTLWVPFSGCAEHGSVGFAYPFT